MKSNQCGPVHWETSDVRISRLFSLGLFRLPRKVSASLMLRGSKSVSVLIVEWGKRDGGLLV